MRRFVIIICIAFHLSCYGQGEFNNWYFGEYTGLSFNGGLASPLNNGAMYAGEGIATISDAAGNLLFYTNGLQVWNSFHTVMPNGSGLLGNLSTTQGVLIVPIPGSTSRFYLFTLGDLTGVGDLHYSIIDLSLDNGKGDVVATSKNIFVTDGQTEKLAAAKATTCGVWVITHKRRSNTFEARLVTSSGVALPILSSVGNIQGATAGSLKVSRDNKKLASVVLDLGMVEVFDFDPATGLVTNEVQVNSSTAYCYSACFSPDGTKLYATEAAGQGNFNIFQYDMSSLSSSKTLVGTAPTAAPSLSFADMQLGPDDQLYITRMATNYLAVVPKPDLKAPTCGYLNNGIMLPNNKRVFLCLPNDIRIQDKTLDFSLGRDTAVCLSHSIILSAPPGAMDIHWSTGATTTSLNVTKSGLYWLRISNALCDFTDSIRISFNDDSVHLGPDTSICHGGSFLLTQPFFQSYLWSDGSTGQDLSITQPGIYSLEATNFCGIKTKDTIQINYRNAAPSFVIKDTVICEGSVINLDAGNNHLDYLWSTGSTSRILPVSQPGLFWVRTTDAGLCVNQDSINVHWNNCGRKLLVPTAFTPNDDGRNDQFQIFHTGFFEQFEFILYDRWGQVIFHSKNPNFLWDGTLNNKKLATGVFVWLCHYKFYGEQVATEKGNLTLIR